MHIRPLNTRSISRAMFCLLVCLHGRGVAGEADGPRPVIRFGSPIPQIDQKERPTVQHHIEGNVQSGWTGKDSERSGFHGHTFPARRAIESPSRDRAVEQSAGPQRNPITLIQTISESPPTTPGAELTLPPAPSGDSLPGTDVHGENLSESLEPANLPPEPSQPGQDIAVDDGVDLSAFAPPNLPANTDCDVLPWTALYEDRISRSPNQESFQLPPEAIAAIPPDYHPWWADAQTQPVFPGCRQLPVSVDVLTVGALQYSPRVMAITTEPQIRNTFLFEEKAEFDWRSFIESKWQDINEPVGNTLTTGGPNRFKNDLWSGEASLRRRNSLGGELELSQRMGYENQNSRFFIPGQQGNSRLQLTYTQPLMNGRGQAYNESRVVLAQIEINRSFDVVAEELQEHLLMVVEAYWELYRARATYLQRQKLLVSGQKILAMLEGRQEVDAQARQVLRAQAAVAARKTGILRSAANVKNAESRLRLLVNDPRLLELGVIELVPMEPPRSDYLPLSVKSSLTTALIHRPDISQAVRELRATGVRLGVAVNELLPRLDLVMQSYAMGLAGHGDITSALGKQHSEGRPSYSVGFEFELPLGNHAAKARLTRRELELQKTSYSFRTVVETALTEVEIAVREAETSYRELLSNYQAYVAAQTETAYLDDRWQWLPGDDRGTTLLLEDLLDAQERLALSEANLVRSQTQYTISLSRLRKLMGTLLQAEPAAFPGYPENSAQPVEVIHSQPTEVWNPPTEGSL